MLALLERDLSSARADWIIVTYHDPTFNIGGTMGFDYVLRQGGRVVEQFIDASRIGNTWACPFFWGKLRLAGE